MARHLRGLALALLLMGLGGLCLDFSAHPALASAPSPQEAFTVVLSPSRPLVFTDETLRLKAWAISPTQKPLSYEWRATGGHIRPQEADRSEALWDFQGADPGTYSATVRVTDPQAGWAEASVEVTVSFDIRGIARRSVRSFLVQGKKEAEGYGLYSYLLLPSPPTQKTRPTYLRAIAEYLRLILDLEEVKKGDLKSINITYLPLKVPPSEEMLDEIDRARGKEDDKPFLQAAEWMLQKYDYDQAQRILKDLPGNQGKGVGPFFVSFEKPYDERRGPSRPYLYQNLSGFLPHGVSLMVSQFLNQAAQEDFFQERTMQKIVRNLHLILETGSVAVDETVKSYLELKQLGKLIGITS